MKRLRCEQASNGSRFGCCHPFQAFALHSAKIRLRAARDAGLDTSTNRGTELLDYDPMTIAQKVFLTRYVTRVAVEFLRNKPCMRRSQPLIMQAWREAGHGGQDLARNS